MVKLVGLLRKREDLSTQEFQAYWLGTHTAIARRLPGLRRYSVNLIDREQFPESSYDGFSELWFDSLEAFHAAFASPEGQEVTRDIPKFIGQLTRVVVDEHAIVEG